MSPTECAVFFKHRTTSAPISPAGEAYRTSEETTCVIFDRLEAARQYCETRVQALPQARCEVYDQRGLAKPPLLVIVHPDVRKQEDTGSIWSRRRKLIAAVLILASLPLFWMGAKEGASSDIAIFFGINCIVAALRFIYWDYGIKHREKQRLERVEAHQKAERGDA